MTGESVEVLEAELAGIGAEIEEAAVLEAASEWLRLSQRKDALPALIREAKAAPLRREVERLERELEALDQEMRRARQGPPPPVPEAMRGSVTPAMVRNQRIGGITAQASRAGKELVAAREQLARIESEG